MATNKRFRPTSPSRRLMTVSNYNDLTSRSSSPLKALTEAHSSKGGRSNTGRIAVRFRGGGHKRKYRIIDNKRDKDNVPATVARIEYDPNRTARIALLHYADGEKRYMLVPVGIGQGSTVVSGAGVDIQPGNCLPLANIPPGTTVHGVELKPNKGAQLVRSAGCGAKIMAFDGGYALLRLPSGELRKIDANCRATIGQVGNIEHENLKLGKAGRSRWLGRMPHNRGVTMNPVDHPLGGGEGKSSGGRHPMTPWGKPTRGAKTRRNKRTSVFIVASASSKKKKRG